MNDENCKPTNIRTFFKPQHGGGGIKQNPKKEKSRTEKQPVKKSNNPVKKYKKNNSRKNKKHLQNSSNRPVVESIKPVVESINPLKKSKKAELRTKNKPVKKSSNKTVETSIKAVEKSNKAKKEVNTGGPVNVTKIPHTQVVVVRMKKPIPETDVFEIWMKTNQNTLVSTTTSIITTTPTSIITTTPTSINTTIPSSNSKHVGQLIIQDQVNEKPSGVQKLYETSVDAFIRPDNKMFQSFGGNKLSYQLRGKTIKKNKKIIKIGNRKGEESKGGKMKLTNTTRLQNGTKLIKYKDIVVENSDKSSSELKITVPEDYEK